MIWHDDEVNLCGEERHPRSSKVNGRTWYGGDFRIRLKVTKKSNALLISGDV